MKKVYVCSPYRGDVDRNTDLARQYSRFVAKVGYCPVTPHLVYPQFLNDNDPDERILGLKLGVELLKVCDEVWIFGTVISQGMAYELDHARKHNIPVRIYDLALNRIMGDTLQIDDRIDDYFRRAVHGLRFA